LLSGESLPLLPNEKKPSGKNSSNLPIALDAMGGDLGSHVQAEGAIIAYKEFGAKSILVGKEDELKASLSSLGAGDLPIEIVDAPEIIDMNDSPAKAVRRKPNASLCVAYRLVMEGKASAVLSSGNSGAMMAAGRILCGLLPGIERPAIATLIPTYGDGLPNVVIDSGANVDCHASHLVQFAVMGAIYHSSLFEMKNPRIALLANGTEASKGTDMIRSASLILSKMEGLNYIGYVEGRDVTTSKAEVIVCDGFVGNVLLKAMEGCVTLIYKQIKFESEKRPFARLGMLLSRGLMKQVFRGKFDYSEHGGAPLLGLKKLALVLHGSSDARAVKNALRLAKSFVDSGMTEKITSAMSGLEEQMMDLDAEFISGVFAAGQGPLNGVKRKSKKMNEDAQTEIVLSSKSGSSVSQDEI
jgi:phosphate acyltransferase